MKAVFNDEELDISDEGEQVKDINLGLELELLVRKLSKRNKKIVKLFVQGLPQKEIAKKCKVNQATISRLKKLIKKEISA